MKKTLYTLNVNDYVPEIVALTYPLFRIYADKIGADFHVITDRQFPDFPLTYEKLQIYKIAQDRKDEFIYFFDSDALVHPDFFDPTDHLSKDTVLHNASDMAGNRWKYDRFFRRDGRHIGSCNWFAVASDWCIDLWHPLDDLTAEEAIANIQPISAELQKGVLPEHLIDDYVLSRNIAKYGLKFSTCKQLLAKLGREKDDYFRHEYLLSTPEKIVALSQQIESWGLMGLDVIKTLRASAFVGWMGATELYWLGNMAKSHSRILEIGSYHGRSTRVLADNTEGHVCAVDTWDGSEEHKGKPEMINSYNQFCINMQDLIATERVRPLRMTSMQAAAHMNGDKFDMIFIDGAHDYESVKADISTWRKKLAPGGLLCGHDYGPQFSPIADSSKFGVTRAIDELIPNVKHGPGLLWYSEPSS